MKEENKKPIPCSGDVCFMKEGCPRYKMYLEQLNAMIKMGADRSVIWTSSCHGC